MNCPKCGCPQPDGAKECLQCGVIFEKIPRHRRLPAEFMRPEGSQAGEDPAAGDGSLPVGTLLFRVEDTTDPLVFAGRVLLFLVLFLWGWRVMLTSPQDASATAGFLHLVNLPFHEAGHVLLRPFGHFIASLGGTLGQLIMPLVCMITLLLRTSDPFGAAVALWWFGENFLDIAPYINDANRLVLPLLGGNTGQGSPYGFHDWEYLLTETGMLGHAQAAAYTAHGLGVLIMILSLFWAGYVLFRQYRHLDGRGTGKRPGSLSGEFPS